MNRIHLYFFAILILFIQSAHAQCWKTIDTKGDTSSVILAIRNDNTLWDFTSSSTGVQVGNQAIWEKCYTGPSCQFAIAQDSSLWGWGNNWYGELGIGNTNNQPNIILLNNQKWIDVSSNRQTAAIRKDGTLWYWGWGANSLLPIQFGLANDWKDVQTYYGGAFLLKNNGTLWNVYFSNNSAQQIGTDSDWQSVWPFTLHSSGWLGIKTNGTLWYNGVQVGTDTDWKMVRDCHGYFAAYGLKTDGTLWKFSRNTNTYQFDPSIPPTQITTLSNVNQISASNYSLIAIHNSNKLWIEQYNQNMPCTNSINCSNSLSLNASNNSVNSGGMVTFNAFTADPVPNYIWQSNFGQGYVNLINYGNYSGANTSTLTVSNVQLANHQQPIRVISVAGNCVDTSNVVYIMLNDTCINTVTNLITVTDTLLINTSTVGVNPPNNVNTIKVFPNPASTHITIDYGNYALLNGYQLKIENSLGQQVFQTSIGQQSNYLDLSSWGGNGIYFIRLINPQGNTIDIRKIVIQ